MGFAAKHTNDMLAPNRHMARILALGEEWKAAASRHDLDGMMGIYGPDAQELLVIGASR